MKEEIFRLVKPRKKGLLRLVFSRFLFIIILIVVQVLILTTLYYWLYQYSPYFAAFFRLVAFLTVVYLFNNSMDSSAKLTWMLLISLAPLPGTAFLLFTQTNAGNRKTKENVARCIEQTRDFLVQDPDVKAVLSKDGSGTDDLSTYLSLGNSFPVFDHTQVTYFPLGEDKFEAMLEELKKAEKFIFLEYFIIEEGYMWGEILRILIEKAKAGVDVRVMYDGMCEISTLPFNYGKLLDEHGIKARSFSPIRPVVSSHYNYRDHRKILVIDGKVAFNGGVNLADEYINRIERFGHWKDTALMLKGPAVRSFTLMFLQMWNTMETEHDFSQCDVIPEEAADAEGYVMPFADCPLDEYKAGETVYMDILNRATDYVYIMTPYLILDGELETALRFAAQRGVDVRLMLPGIPDKKIAYALAKSHYWSLKEAGIKIYEYTPGFVHAKVFVSDDCKAVVGTINLDYRSLYHHFECATYLYKVPCIARIKEDFLETQEKCRLVTDETMRTEKLFYRIVGPLVKFIAPLM